MGNRTIVIGLDGATFRVLDHLIEEGEMPFLSNCMSNGVRGILESVTPPLTPPAWTTIMTGRSPGNHGIFDFFKYESNNGRFLTLSNSRDIKCETLWSILSRHRLTSASINFAMMAPVRPIAGYLIPGWVPWRLMKRAFYPAELYDRLKVLPGFNLKELATDVQVDEKAIEGCAPEEYEEWIDMHTRREERWFDILSYIIEEGSCDLVAVVFDGVDKIQHLCWRFLDPSFASQNPLPWEIKVRDKCVDYFRKVDSFIKKAVSLGEPDTNYFIVSDHGFTATTEVLYINTWLNQNGYLEWANGVKGQEVNGKLGLELNRKQSYLLDWDKTKAYAFTTGSNGICICVAGDRGEQGISPEEYPSFRQELINRLYEIKDPNTGERVITKILTREEAFAGDHMNNAPDLTLTLRDNGFVSIRESDILLEPRPEPLGTHHPDGVFIAWGNDIQQGISLPKISILDVTPTLVYSLGLPVPQDLEGQVVSDIFNKSVAAERPISIGESTVKPNPFPKSPRNAAADDTSFSPDDEEEIKKKLKALGYME